jgi:tetratricopeptide (TPR) repeat protein
MKRTERHRLKENEVASTVARATQTFERHKTSIVGGAVAVVVVAAGLAGFFAWRSQADSRSREMLADAMAVAETRVTPAPAPGAAPASKPAGGFASAQARDQAALARVLAAANAYPSTEAGIAARYYAAATLARLGRTAEAIQQYQQVVAAAGDSVYGRMAKLGMADANVAAGRYDAAIATYREFAAASAGDLPLDGILMQMAYAYQAAGKPAEARQAFKRVADEFPQSPYAADARRAVDALKG